MISTIDEAQRFLFNLFPPGHDELYDETPGSDPWLFFEALGESFKTLGFDVLATLQREIVVPSMVAKLPDWEAATGIANYLVALFGTTQQRQSSLIAKFRESGPFSDPVVASIFSALFGFFPTTPVQILKAQRADLRLLHSYGRATDFAIPVGTTTSILIHVDDGGLCAKAGVQLDLNFAVGDLAGYVITLTAPDGTAVTWEDDWTEVPFRLYGIAFAGKPIHGLWTLSIFNGGAVPNTLFSAPWLFVEGIAPNQDTGGAVFHWGVYADVNHLGENGATPDFQSARAAIERIKHSHTVGDIIQSLDPWPDVVSGTHSSIPDECVPV